MPLTFRAGIHPADQKYRSEKQMIGEFPPPQKVYIPVSQHIGKPARPAVCVGDTVKAGQIIAKSDGIISADIFASVAGKVTEIKDMPTPNGHCAHIVIENDGTGESVLLKPLPETAKSEELVRRIREAGIVGMGGAGFPTDYKISSATKTEVYIINAAECEPYITCDYRIMLDYTEQFLRGCLILKRAANASRLIIGIEDNKPEAVTRLRGEIERNKFDIEIAELKSKFPQGAEKQIIYAATGKKVAPGKLPSSVGALVSNVHTALSAYFAVTKGQPLYRRVMTVTGGGIKNPANLWVPNGSLYSDIVNYVGGYSEENTVKLLNGGPMTGVAVDHLDYATTKTTGCLLFLTDEEAFTGNPMPCIKCGKCARVCPMRLMPMYIDAYALVGDATMAVKYGARDCIECGCCTYTCPAKRPLVQSIRLAKKKDAAKGRKA